jgi:hypothetical protein
VELCDGDNGKLGLTVFTDELHLFEHFLRCARPFGRISICVSILPC